MQRTVDPDEVLCDYMLSKVVHPSPQRLAFP